jgi:hypothetical protein
MASVKASCLPYPLKAIPKHQRNKARQKHFEPIKDYAADDKELVIERVTSQPLVTRHLLLTRHSSPVTFF